MDKTWLYHYDPETKQQSMEWWHSGSPLPKNSECKNQLEKFTPRFFGIKMVSSSFIIFQRATLSTRSITHLCWCKWRTFWRKNAAWRSPKCSCSCTTMPQLTRRLQPRRNWPTWASSFLITHPILRIWPRRTTTCSLDWENNWLSSKGRHYQREVLLISAGAIEGYFKGKTPREFHQECLVLAWQCPCSTGTCNYKKAALKIIKLVSITNLMHNSFNL